jgi:class 3 adenylate cyclase
LCGFRTYALVEDVVLAARREPLTVKGASRPVDAWEILELRESEGERALESAEEARA